MGVTTPLPAPGRHHHELFSVARARAVGALAAMLVALVVITNIVFDDPTFVDRISFENRSRYDLRLEVSNDGGTGWLPVGVASQRCTTDFHLVIDQGPTWRIRFHSQGSEGGQITVTRADLQRADWTFQIPDSVEAQLSSRQAPLPPVRRCAAASPTTG